MPTPILHSIQPHALQLLRIESEGGYAALVAGSPSADAQEDAVRSASHTTLSAAAHLLTPAIDDLHKPS